MTRSNRSKDSKFGASKRSVFSKASRTSKSKNRDQWIYILFKLSNILNIFYFKNH